MNRKLLTLTIAGALALGGGAALEANDMGGGRHGHRHGKMGFGIEHMTKELDLTPQQQAQVNPILDQAKPQIQAIHKEAMEKTRAIMEETMAKIRPLLTPEQQATFDRKKAAHEKMREAMKEMHEADSD